MSAHLSSKEETDLGKKSLYMCGSAWACKKNKKNNPCVSKSVWEPAYVWRGYRIGARLSGYEVTVRPAGIELRGKGVCVFVRYGWKGG